MDWSESITNRAELGFLPDGYIETDVEYKIELISPILD